MKNEVNQGSLLGAFEELVLLAGAHLGGRAYGMQVRREIERRTGRSVAIGAVYATLERMHDKGFLDSRLAAAGSQRRGRPRRYFSLQPPGLLALRNTHRLHRQMWEGLDAAGLKGEGEAQP